MKLAYFSPLNPLKSGISDYSEELLPSLAAQAEVDLFVDGFAPTCEEITSRFKIFDYRSEPKFLQRLKHYDALICQLGNSHRYHAGIYEVANQFPAIIVFHDFALQHFFLERSRALKNPNIYLDELEISASREDRLEAEEALSRGVAPPQYQNPVAFPMNFRLANRAEGLIVHSEWSRSRLARIAPGVPIAKINHHVKIASDESRRKAANGSRPLTIASFGFITSTKGLECAIRSLAALKSDHLFHYYLVGEPDSYFDIEELLRVYNMSDRVSISGFVDFAEFNQRIAETDIAINLRDQTVGETSGSLCRLMASGVPTVVSNIGWFSEIPDDCAIKVDPGPDADVLVSAYLKELSENAELRRQIGANARKFMLAHHTVKETTTKYLEFIEQVIAGRARRRFVDSVAGDIAQLSSGDPDELLLSAVVPRLTELLA